MTVGDRISADWQLLVPDDGTGTAVAGWAGTPAIRSVAGGLTWTVLLETGEAYLDRYTLPMRTVPPGELQGWRQRVRPRGRS